MHIIRYMSALFRVIELSYGIFDIFKDSCPQNQFPDKWTNHMLQIQQFAQSHRRIYSILQIFQDFDLGDFTDETTRYILLLHTICKTWTTVLQ